MTPGVSNAGTALDRPRAFAELLRSHRRAAGLTQEKLAERAGISVRALRKLESGASQTPHRDTVALLAQALQLRDDERGTFAAAGRPRREQALALASAAPLGVPIPGASTPDGTPSQRVARPASATITYLPEVLAGRLPPSVASQQRSNLTVPPTALLGREHELERIGALLRSEKVRLVTLTGPGGVGKTRLSLEVAAQVLDAFPDGVWSVRLSQLTDPDLVLPTIATTLHLKESSETPITEVLLAYLGEKRLLIVLDNFEHLAAAAPRIGALLAACPGVRALVTSRVALHLRAERECPISPLALPDLQHLPAPERLTRFASVALFLERAHAARASFKFTHVTAPYIVAICARLDGLPLAIELAAPWIKVLSPRALLNQLEQVLSMLVGGALDLDARQQTMRRTLAWSDALLSPEERRLFRRLAVFVSGFTLEAAEAVCATPEGTEPLAIDVPRGLESLVDQGLVQSWMTDQAHDSGDEQRDRSGAARFRMLFVVREYALEQLEASAEAETIRRAHARYFLTLAEPTDWHQELGRAGTRFLDQLEREHDNCRAALTWARTRQDAELSLRLGAVLAQFWQARGYWHEGRKCVEELLELWAAPSSGKLDVTHLDGPRWAMEIRRRWGRATALAWATLLSWAGVFAGAQGEVKRAVALLEKSVAAARAIEAHALAAANLQNIGRNLLESGETVRGLAFIEEALIEARQLDRDEEKHIYVLVQASYCLLSVPGEEHRAQALAEEGLKLAQRVNLPYHKACAHASLAIFALRRGNLARAGEHAAAALRVARDHDLTFLASGFLDVLAIVAGRQGRSERTARLQGAAAELREAMGAVPEVPVLAEIEATMLRGRAALGEAGWAVTFKEGQALTLEDAIAEALDEVDRDRA